MNTYRYHNEGDCIHNMEKAIRKRDWVTVIELAKRLQEIVEDVESEESDGYCPACSGEGTVCVCV